jgi:predicted site-specific integrase-resolvase
MTPRQVARLLQIDVGTVRLWGRLGVLKDGFSPGGPERFRRADVLTFFSCRSVKRSGGQRANPATADFFLS